jgi:tRNA dimethylallyltransferase
MLAAGLEQEAREVYPLREHNALQTVGYRELFDHFDGTIGRAEAVELIRRNSRRYAKRQMTWFGRDADIVWFTDADADRVIRYLDRH